MGVAETDVEDVVLVDVPVDTSHDFVVRSAQPEIRMAERKDGPVISDNGNFIIDAKFDEIESPLHLEIDLNTIPGVVENGLFTEMVDKVILGTKDGIKEL